MASQVTQIRGFCPNQGTQFHRKPHLEFSVSVHVVKSTTEVCKCFVKGQYSGQRDESFVAYITANCDQSAKEGHQNPCKAPQCCQPGYSSHAPPENHTDS